jgi:hypothetical protein
MSPGLRVLGASLCLAAEGLGMQAAARATPGAIDLICSAEVATAPGQTDAICAAVVLALTADIADRAGWYLRRDAADPAGLTITLVLTRADAHSVTAYLSWRTPLDPIQTDGPAVSAQTVDAPLAADIYPNFARGLLQVSDLPF